MNDLPQGYLIGKVLENGTLEGDGGKTYQLKGTDIPFYRVGTRIPFKPSIDGKYAIPLRQNQIT